MPHDVEHNAPQREQEQGGGSRGAKIGEKTLDYGGENRWGQLVYSGSDIRNGWDGTFGGKRVDSGVFVYYASYTIRGINNTMRGLITLIR